MEWAIEQGSVSDWATRYDGAPYHAMICDAPYELAFMGRKLDHWLGNPITTIAKDNGETVTAEQRVQFEDENALRARMAQGGHDGSQERA